MKKFIKSTKKKLTVPHAVMEMSGFQKDGAVELCALDNVVVILRKEMTAMELVRAIDSLQEAALELTGHLADACGPCEDCSGGEGCPADPSRTATVIPEEVRQEAGFPVDAKLCAWPGDIPGTVTVGRADYRYDLTDVPAWLLEILASHGVCLGMLEERLMEEDVAYVYPGNQVEIVWKMKDFCMEE